MSNPLRLLPVPIFLQRRGTEIEPANEAGRLLAMHASRLDSRLRLDEALRRAAERWWHDGIAGRLDLSPDGGETAAHDLAQLQFRQVCAVPSVHPDQRELDALLIVVDVLSSTRAAEFEKTLNDHLKREAFWDEYARSYDRILPLMPFYQLALERHLSAISAILPKHVLDIGAGTGNVAIPLAQAGCAVTLVDPSPAMLSRAARKAEQTGVTHLLRIHSCSAESIENLPDGGFDAVNLLLTLFCMSDAEKVLEMSVRCLRPGGLIVFTEPLHAFSETPLLEVGIRILQQRDNWPELQSDWDVVCHAGHKLGTLIRESQGSSASGQAHSLRADDLPASLERLHCEIVTNLDAHLGQARHIVARRTN